MMTHCLPVSDTSYSYQHGVKIYPVVDAMVVWKVALICRTAMYAPYYHQLAHLVLGGYPNLPQIEKYRITTIIFGFCNFHSVFILLLKAK